VRDAKTRTSDQSQDHQAVFNIIACLQCVVPEVECLCDLAAKTDQQKQERTELKKVSPHFSTEPLQFASRAGDAPRNYRSFHMKGTLRVRATGTRAQCLKLWWS
jgi:hypothetical protein